MAIKQLLIFVEYTKRAVDASGKEIFHRQIVRSDFVNANINRFLAGIPADIDEKALISIILISCGDDIISFADGSDKDGNPINDEYRKNHRETTSSWAQIYLNDITEELPIQPQFFEEASKENSLISSTLPKQFIIWVSVTKSETNSLGKEHVYNQVYDIDLVSENVADFLAKLPDDIDEKTTVWVSITRPDGKTLSFADGADKYGKPLDEVERDHYRKDATLFASRRLNKLSDPT